MIEIKEGIIYDLDNFVSGAQRVKFTEKLPDGTFLDGTTNEEVINMLIERFYSLQKKNYSSENATILIMLKNIRRLLALRFKRKKENTERYEENNNYSKK
jgi:hypothetical protein